MSIQFRNLHITFLFLKYHTGLKYLEEALKQREYIFDDKFINYVTFINKQYRVADRQTPSRLLV